MKGRYFRQKSHSDRTRYIIFVLWLIGYGKRQIGDVLSMRTRQVEGIIERSEYSNRAGMTDADRQAFLDELAAIREDEDGKIDGGILDPIPFKIIPLCSRQKAGPLKRRMRRGDR